MLADATIMRIAVAYLSVAGVAALESLLDSSGRPRTVEVITRATHNVPGTTAEHLRALEVDLGAETRAFVGADAARFHPKVFMTRTPSANWTLSGSGNLTLGGLGTNAEQFELLRTQAGPVMPGRRPAAKYESIAGNDLTARWATWWGTAMPLSAALAHPAFVEWQAQAKRRAELERDRRKLDEYVEDKQPGDDTIPPDGLNTSRTATEQKVRGRMDTWFPDPKLRRRIYELMADAIEICNSLNPDGWWCGYVTDGSQHDLRLTVCARNAQVFVVQQKGDVYFNAPPAADDQAAFDLCLKLAEIPGVRVTPSRRGGKWGQPFVHPYAEVPAGSLASALEAGAARLLGAAAQWRMAEGRAPHWGVHSPALVATVRKETGRNIPQPSYEA
jgi:hypothetical protein